VTILNSGVGEAIALKPSLNTNWGELRNGTPTVAKKKSWYEHQQWMKKNYWGTMILKPP